MGKVFDFMKNPDLFRVRYINNGLFLTQPKSGLEIHLELSDDLRENLISLDLASIADDVPAHEIQLTSEEEGEEEDDDESEEELSNDEE